jgi:Thiamine pyrophosphate enzyme, N-terminal TPP binding domain
VEELVMSKGSDLLVAALVSEGVDCIFGVPGEENLDTVESLRTSSIELVISGCERQFQDHKMTVRGSLLVRLAPPGPQPMTATVA